MRIHVISTINGKLNEGMRNVATHVTRGLERNHEVTYSESRDLLSNFFYSCFSDVVMIFARANRRVYWLCRILGLVQKNIWIVCVQKPNEEFTNLVNSKPLPVGYLSLLEDDLTEIALHDCYKKEQFFPGINAQKFTAVDKKQQRTLKEKYGFSIEKPLVLHVGHCSAGRGLEDFLHIRNAEKVVVASGMFEHIDTIKTLETDNVRIIRGYQEQIEEFYQMADVYFFPTRTAEFVISIPLSVMEALSCGVPVIGYQEFGNLEKISAEEVAITMLENGCNLSDVIDVVASNKQNQSLLKNPQTWEQVVERIALILEENLL